MGFPSHHVKNIFLMKYLTSLALLVAVAMGGVNNAEKVLLKDVTVLTLRAGAMTTGRRSSPSAFSFENLFIKFG
jgi:hypothetical protein